MKFNSRKDIEYIQKSDKAYEYILGYISGHKDTLAIRKLNRAYSGMYYIPNLIKGYNFYLFFTMTETNHRACFFDLKVKSNRNAIGISIVVEEEANSSNEVKKFLLPRIVSILKTRKSSLIHELSHLFDYLKHKDINDTSTNLVEYYNDYHEINSFYIQFITVFKKRYDKKFKTFEDFRRQFFYLLNLQNKDFWKYLNSINRKKFLIRLYQFWDDNYRLK